VHILVCDDHAVFAEALARLLRRRGFEVTISFDPDDAQAIVRECPIDVCLMDLWFACGASGVDGARRVREVSPTTAVLIISGATGDETIRAAMEAAACGCISKTASAEQVVASLLRAHAGSRFFVAMGDTGREHGDRKMSSGDAKRLASLTLRESEVLQHLVSGETAAVIGQRLGISYATSRAHIQRVLVKLGTHSAAETVALAARNGLRPTG
jgi:two-component system, NarL family, nitrate/nitrite response regulator NarL